MNIERLTFPLKFHLSGDEGEGWKNFSGGRPEFRCIYMAKNLWKRLRLFLKKLVGNGDKSKNQDISSEIEKTDERGRPTIPDNFLVGARNAWVLLLEESWSEVGWPLQSIRRRTVASTEVALLELNQTSEESIELGAIRRYTDLIHLQKRLSALGQEKHSIEAALVEQEACFKQLELLDYLQSGRYAIKPLRLANALAGLPIMEWRQSSSRCAKMPYDCEPHLWYRVFSVIDEIWEKRPEDPVDTPSEFFRARLQALTKKHGYVCEFLLKNWRDLRLAIEECRRSKISPSEMPFAISRAFVRFQSLQKDPAERIRVESESIEK